MSEILRSEAAPRRAAEQLAATLGLELCGEGIDGDREPERCHVGYLCPRDGHDDFTRTFPAGWWVYLATDIAPLLIRSSTVIGVSKKTGTATVLGDAGDEG